MQQVALGYPGLNAGSSIPPQQTLSEKKAARPAQIEHVARAVPVTSQTQTGFLDAQTAYPAVMAEKYEGHLFAASMQALIHSPILRQ